MDNQGDLTSEEFLQCERDKNKPVGKRNLEEEETVPRTEENILKSVNIILRARQDNCLH